MSNLPSWFMDDVIKNSDPYRRLERELAEAKEELREVRKMNADRVNERDKALEGRWKWERELSETRRELEQAKRDLEMYYHSINNERETLCAALGEVAKLTKQLTAHKEVVGMCREIIEGCINNQPASEGGGMYYERFDGDGNYSGVEHVDPAAIYQATLDELHKVLTAIAKLMEGSK